MTDKHTPTPWEVTDTCSNYVFDVVRIGNKDIRVGSEANARHIVKCVNYHDRLVEALREAKEFMEIELDGEAYGQCMGIAHSIGRLLSELELDTKKESGQ